MTKLITTASLNLNLPLWLQNYYSFSFLITLIVVYALICVLGLIFLVLGIIKSLKKGKVVSKYYGRVRVSTNASGVGKVSPDVQFGDEEKYDRGNMPANLKRDENKKLGPEDLGLIGAIQFYLSTLIEGVLPEESLQSHHFSSLHTLSSFYEFLKFNAYYQAYFNSIAALTLSLVSANYLAVNVFKYEDCSIKNSEASCTKSINYLSTQSKTVCQWINNSCSLSFDFTFTNETFFLTLTIVLLLHMMVFYFYDKFFHKYFDCVSLDEVSDQSRQNTQLYLHEDIQHGNNSITCCRDNKISDITQRNKGKIGIKLSNQAEDIFRNHSILGNKLCKASNISIFTPTKVLNNRHITKLLDANHKYILHYTQSVLQEIKLDLSKRMNPPLKRLQILDECVLNSLFYVFQGHLQTPEQMLHKELLQEKILLDVLKCAILNRNQIIELEKSLSNNRLHPSYASLTRASCFDSFCRPCMNGKVAKHFNSELTTLEDFDRIWGIEVKTVAPKTKLFGSNTSTIRFSDLSHIIGFVSEDELLTADVKFINQSDELISVNSSQKNVRFKSFFIAKLLKIVQTVLVNVDILKLMIVVMIKIGTTHLIEHNILHSFILSLLSSNHSVSTVKNDAVSYNVGSCVALIYKNFVCKDFVELQASSDSLDDSQEDPSDDNISGSHAHESSSHNSSQTLDSRYSYSKSVTLDLKSLSVYQRVALLIVVIIMNMFVSLLMVWYVYNWLSLASNFSGESASISKFIAAMVNIFSFENVDIFSFLIYSMFVILVCSLFLDYLLLLLINIIYNKIYSCYKVKLKRVFERMIDGVGDDMSRCGADDYADINGVIKNCNVRNYLRSLDCYSNRMQEESDGGHFVHRYFNSCYYIANKRELSVFPVTLLLTSLECVIPLSSSDHAMATNSEGATCCTPSVNNLSVARTICGDYFVSPDFFKETVAQAVNVPEHIISHGVKSTARTILFVLKLICKADIFVDLFFNRLPRKTFVAQLLHQKFIFLSIVVSLSIMYWIFTSLYIVTAWSLSASYYYYVCYFVTSLVTIYFIISLYRLFSFIRLFNGRMKASLEYDMDNFMATGVNRTKRLACEEQLFEDFIDAGGGDDQSLNKEGAVQQNIINSDRDGVGDLIHHVGLGANHTDENLTSDNNEDENNASSSSANIQDQRFLEGGSKNPNKNHRSDNIGHDDDEEEGGDISNNEEEVGYMPYADFVRNDSPLSAPAMTMTRGRIGSEIAVKEAGSNHSNQLSTNYNGNFVDNIAALLPIHNPRRFPQEDMIKRSRILTAQVAKDSHENITDASQLESVADEIIDKWDNAFHEELTKKSNESLEQPFDDSLDTDASVTEIIKKNARGANKFNISPPNFMFNSSNDITNEDYSYVMGSLQSIRANLDNYQGVLDRSPPVAERLLSKSKATVAAAGSSSNFNKNKEDEVSSHLLLLKDKINTKKTLASFDSFKTSVVREEGLLDNGTILSGDFDGRYELDRDIQPLSSDDDYFMQPNLSLHNLLGNTDILSEDKSLVNLIGGSLTRVEAMRLAAAEQGAAATVEKNLALNDELIDNQDEAFGDVDDGVPSSLEDFALMNSIERLKKNITFNKNLIGDVQDDEEELTRHTEKILQRSREWSESAVNEGANDNRDVFLGIKNGKIDESRKYEKVLSIPQGYSVGSSRFPVPHHLFDTQYDDSSSPLPPPRNDNNNNNKKRGTVVGATPKNLHSMHETIQIEEGSQKALKKPNNKEKKKVVSITKNVDLSKQSYKPKNPSLMVPKQPKGVRMSDEVDDGKDRNRAQDQSVADYKIMMFAPKVNVSFDP